MSTNDNFDGLWANFRAGIIDARTQGKRNIKDTPAHAATDGEVLAEVSALLYDVYEAVTKSTNILDTMNRIIECDGGGRMGYWGDEGMRRSVKMLQGQAPTVTNDPPEPYAMGLVPTMPEDLTADKCNEADAAYFAQYGNDHK